MTSKLRWLGAALSALVALAVVAPVASARAGSAPVPAQRLRLDVTDLPQDIVTIPADQALPDRADRIGPGSALLITIPGSGTFICTANWVWASGATRYLGAAGHCFLPDNKKATHGPGADFNPSGVVTRVCVSGCLTGGTMTGIFGTWATLGALKYARQTGSGGDVGNDFGIVTVPTNLHSSLRTSLPMFGGPPAEGTLSLGEVTCHYGNAAGLGEVYPTKGRVGVGRSSSGSVWYAVHPAFQGDSGSAFATCRVDSDGGIHGREAIGVLTHITGNGIAGTTMTRAVAMAAESGTTISALL